MKGENMREKQGWEEGMERSKKSDEESAEDFATFLALLIGSNFLEKSVSYIVGCSGNCIHYTH